MSDSILFYIFAVSTIILVFYSLFFHAKLLFYKPINKKVSETNLPQISVVISAKDEDLNLQKFLRRILMQNYPKFEVVVVDDGSDDDTYYVLKDFQNDFKNLNVIRLGETVNFYSGKKFPLSIGIRSAKYEHLLLTDADCFPTSPNWIKEIAAGFSENKSIVLGYGKYKTQKGLLNKLIRFETINTAIQYFSFALRGLSYMGVGRNLAYKKELFLKNKGFSKYYTKLSGDDDLFINQVANAKNVSISINPESFTISRPKAKFKDWVKQKRRHLTTSYSYKIKHKILLSLYSSATLIFYVSFIASLSTTNNFYLIFSLFIIRSIIFIVILKKIMQKFEEKNFLIYSLFFEIFIITFLGFLFLLNIISKPAKWK